MAALPMANTAEARYEGERVGSKGPVNEPGSVSVLDYLQSVMATAELEDAHEKAPAVLHDAVCSHCAERSRHELVAVGVMRASEYRCSHCSGRTCMCTNFAVCNGAARGSLLWDDALCSTCEGAVQRFSSGDLTLEGMVQKLKEPKLQEPVVQEEPEPEPDGWAVLAHLLLPPGVPGSTLRRRRKKTTTPHHVVGSPAPNRPEASEDSRTRRRSWRATIRTGSLSPVRMQRPSLDDDDSAAPVFGRHDSAAPAFKHLPSVGTAADALEEAPTLHEGSAVHLMETAQALKAAMHVTRPVTEVPEEVMADARSTDREPWEYMREALLSWPGPERANVDKYRAMLCHPAWIKRWLKACDGDMVWAMKRVLTHLEWRQEFKVDNIMSEDWAEYDRRFEMYPSGICKAGRPTWTWNIFKHGYVANGIQPNATPEMGARYLILTLERTWAMNPAANRFNTICNCHGMGLSNYEHQMCLLCLNILSEHYPDNMEVCWLFPVTWVMSACVAVCRPMVSDETYAKHKILQEEQARRTLAAAFDAEELEPMLGGTLDLATSLTRNYLLENPAALRIWQEEEELALRCFEPGAQARELQRQVLAARGADAALADASHARPGLEGYGEPFGPCMRIWRVNASHARCPFPGVTGDNLLMTKSWSESSLAMALLSSGEGERWSRRTGEDEDSSGPPVAGDQASLDHPVPAPKTLDFYTLHAPTLRLADENESDVVESQPHGGTARRTVYPGAGPAHEQGTAPTRLRAANSGRADEDGKEVADSCTLWDDARRPSYEISEDSEIGPELMRAAPCRPTRRALPRPPERPADEQRGTEPARLRAANSGLADGDGKEVKVRLADATRVPGAWGAHGAGWEEVTSGGTAAAAAGMVVAQGNGRFLVRVAVQCGHEVLSRIGTVLRAAVRAGASAALRVLRGASTSARTTERD